jgi:L-threonylcarbamoyladenylate synthase
LISPGLLENHYAPTNKQLFIFKGPEEALRPQSDIGIVSLRTLSSSGSLQEAAANLYDYIHELDRSTDIAKIIAVLLPDQGLGRAINDKLVRASSGLFESQLR